RDRNVTGVQTCALPICTYNGPIAPAYVILSDSNFEYIGFVRFQPQIIRGEVSNPSTVGWQGKEQHTKISIKNNLPVITQNDNPRSEERRVGKESRSRER